MKFWKNMIRGWFTLTSLAIFLTGWVTLAHSPKPNQFDPSDIPPMPKLDPVMTLKKAMFMEQENMQIVSRRAVVLRSGGS